MKCIRYTVVGTVLLTGALMAESSHPLTHRSAVTPVQQPLNESFETDFNMTGWHTWSDTRTEWARSSWTPKSTSANAVIATGTGQESAAWLVSPAIQLPDSEAWHVSWQEKFNGVSGFHILDVMISLDYHGQADPHTANWFHLSSQTPLTNEFDWRQTTFPLAEFQGQKIHIAFHASLDENATWLVDDVLISAGQQPVNLAELVLDTENRALAFDWKTITETHHYGFEVYRSADAYGTYHQIGSWENPGVESGLLENPQRVYHFRDKGLINGANYWYRICSIDLSGNRIFSEPLQGVPSAITAIHLAAN